MFLIAVGGSLVGQLLVIYFPPLQSIFQTEALEFAGECPVVDGHDKRGGGSGGWMVMMMMIKNTVTNTITQTY